MEDKIKQLLKYSFFVGLDTIDYVYLTSEEQKILSEEDYKKIINYILS